MKKAVAIRNNHGLITTVYFLDSEDIISKQTTFTKNEWSRGIVQWQWRIDISNELGSNYEVIGDETEDLGSGLIYRVTFIKKDKATRRNSNDIIEEYMKQWELKV